MARRDDLVERFDTRNGPALTRAMAEAVEALRHDGGLDLVPVLRTAADNADPKLKLRVRHKLAHSFEMLARDAPAVVRALIEAFADDPAYHRELAEKAAMTGHAYAARVVTGLGPAYLGAWVNGDAAGFAAALAGMAATAERRAALADIHGHTAGRGFTAPIPHPQLVADGVGRVDDNDIEVRATAYEILHDCARAGASLDEFLPLLERGSADQRLLRSDRTNQARSMETGRPVASYATGALAVVAARSDEPVRLLQPLCAALGHRSQKVRWAAARAIGSAFNAHDFDLALLEPMLAYREPEHLIAALGHPRLPAEVIAWLTDHGFEPAWLNSLSWPGFVTRDGLGWWVDGIGGAARHRSLTALGRAAATGSVIDEAVPLMLGTLLCGDWPEPPATALAALRQAVEAGASADGLAPWLVPFTRAGGRVSEAAAADARALLDAAGAAHAGPAAAAVHTRMRRVPFRDRSVPTWVPRAHLVPPASRGRDAAALRADHELRVRIAPLWTEPDPGRRADILTGLVPLAHDLVDLRVLQPALTVALLDPDVRVARAAADVTRARADERADIRLAMPALLMIADHPDAAVRATVRLTVRIGDSRHGAARAVFAAHTEAG